MNQMPEQAPKPKHAPDEVSLRDLVSALARHARLIVGLPLVVALLSAAASFNLPDVYQATARLVPPQQSQAGVAAMMSQLAGADGLTAALAAGMGGVKNQTELYIGILKSRTVADRLIDQFDLKKAYATQVPEEARMQLENKTEISIGRGGFINIDVEDTDGKRAALLANAYYEELVKLADQVAVTEATRRTKFFKHQLEQARNNLAAAELALKQGTEVDKPRLLRDVKYGETVYELLVKQYEVARLDEEKDPGTIQLLDRAVEPTKKYKPQRGLIVALSTLFALFIAIVSAFCLEFLGRKAVPKRV
jgi:uncharacterized protein involved in exopolysaccharide biosynthesis